MQQEKNRSNWNSRYRNGKPVRSPAQSTVYERVQRVNIAEGNLEHGVPHYCYHEARGVAGNCRICRVERVGGPKPVASCIRPISPGIQVVTDSPRVKKAREGVIERRLINHPLDCPICDQGGECDLQDQSIEYGSDRTRMREPKRGVEDKDRGPLVKTVITRCIHCTRCIRFTAETGQGEIGTTGRGNETEVGIYIDRKPSSYRIGNLVDLCPVGALTSKPKAFDGRPWEIESLESVDTIDSIRVGVRRDRRPSDSSPTGWKRKRITPNGLEEGYRSRVQGHRLGDKSRYAPVDGSELSYKSDNPSDYKFNGLDKLNINQTVSLASGQMDLTRRSRLKDRSRISEYTISPIEWNNLGLLRYHQGEAIPNKSNLHDSSNLNTLGRDLITDLPRRNLLRRQLEQTNETQRRQVGIHSSDDYTHVEKTIHGGRSLENTLNNVIGYCGEDLQSPNSTQLWIGSAVVHRDDGMIITHIRCTSNINTYRVSHKPNRTGVLARGWNNINDYDMDTTLVGFLDPINGSIMEEEGISYDHDITTRDLDRMNAREISHSRTDICGELKSTRGWINHADGKPSEASTCLNSIRGDIDSHRTRWNDRVTSQPLELTSIWNTPVSKNIYDYYTEGHMFSNNSVIIKECSRNDKNVAIRQ